MTTRISELDAYLSDPEFDKDDLFMITDELVSALDIAEWKELADVSRDKDATWLENFSTAVGAASRIACHLGLCECATSLLASHPYPALQMLAHCQPDVLRESLTDDAFRLIVDVWNRDHSLRTISYTVMWMAGRSEAFKQRISL